jgi:hypothetical protein
MINYRIIQDRAYELAEEDFTIKEIAIRLISIYGIGGDEAWDLSEMAVEDTEASREEEPDWDREMGFDPYEGCYTYDC